MKAEEIDDYYELPANLSGAVREFSRDVPAGKWWIAVVPIVVACEDSSPVDVPLVIGRDRNRCTLGRLLVQNGRTTVSELIKYVRFFELDIEEPTP